MNTPEKREEMEDTLTRYKEALEIIAGRKQCVDGFLSNPEIAEIALDSPTNPPDKSKQQAKEAE